MGTSQTNVEYKEVIVVSNYDGSAYSGLSNSRFSTSYTLDGVGQTAPTDSFAEIGSTGKYVYTVEFPQEGTWLVEIRVSNTTEVVETHFLNVRVKDSSGTTISSQRAGASLGSIDTLNFSGSGVEVEKSGTILNVKITGSTQKMPGTAAGAGSVQTQIQGTAGTLTFSSSTEQ